MPVPFFPHGPDPRRASLTYAPLEVPQGPSRARNEGEEDGDSPRMWVSPKADELTVSQLRKDYYRRVRQHALVERVSRFAVFLAESKYDPNHCHDFMRAAVQALCDGLGADSAYMLELVAEAVAFRVSAYAGRAIDTYEPKSGAPCPVHAQHASRAETAAGWALRSNHVVRVDDYAKEERFERESWPEQDTVRSAINMRVQGGKEPYGVLVAQSESPGRFCETDAIFVQTLANLVSQRLACARAEYHQRRMYEEFRRMMNAREEALSIISHDLRSPATTVKLSLEVLRRSLQGAAMSLSPEQIERAVTRANAGINRMMAMMDELLAMNRAEGDTFSLVRGPVDLREVVEAVLRELKEPIAASGSEICVDGPDSLVGQWDRIRVEQIVSNLLSNAIKYGEGKAIAVEFERCDSMAVFSVRDQGVGIDPENHRRVFERFVRVRAPGESDQDKQAQSLRDSNSYGLGLWIVKRVVEALGGSICLRSGLGAGSAFTVELPLSP
ncbi:GAF domain-containing sensor histidine kinase [Bradymonas sediminis]|nr:GAF domain-containing sensor histidine kinase [Bradymonas sediminis]TDP75403.1 phospho-acceptor domain-containing protein [Bradymonas sediminis]